MPYFFKANYVKKKNLFPKIDKENWRMTVKAHLINKKPFVERESFINKFLKTSQ
jgi:hypothetical protein